MYVKEKNHTHFLNLLEEEQLAAIYFKGKDISKFNNIRLRELQDNLKLSKRRYFIMCSVSSIFRSSTSIASKVEKEHRKLMHSEFELEIFESNLAYLIISGLINIDDCYKKNNFDHDYLKTLLEKYKKQALKPVKEYSYDKKRNCVSEILENGKRIILPYIPNAVKRK